MQILFLSLLNPRYNMHPTFNDNKPIYLSNSLAYNNLTKKFMCPYSTVYSKF